MEAQPEGDCTRLSPINSLAAVRAPTEAQYTGPEKRATASTAVPLDASVAGESSTIFLDSVADHSQVVHSGAAFPSPVVYESEAREAAALGIVSQCACLHSSTVGRWHQQHDASQAARLDAAIQLKPEAQENFYRGASVAVDANMVVSPAALHVTPACGVISTNDPTSYLTDSLLLHGPPQSEAHGPAPAYRLTSYDRLFARDNDCLLYTSPSPRD